MADEDDKKYLFYRCSTDKRISDCSFLENSYAGMNASSVWLVGGGPSLLTAPVETVKDSPAPTFGVNRAGCGVDGEPPLIRPNLWTCFDPTDRFPRSIFLDASIQKFLLGGRRMDLVPGGSEKVCECPNTYFINHKLRSYVDVVDQKHREIGHMLDSFWQAVDIAFKLGFRKIYCVGCDMRIRPSEEQIAFAESVGVVYDRERGLTIWLNDKKVEVRSDRLSDFRDQVKEKGKFRDKSSAALALEKVGRERQYSFDESKRFMAACASDNHYWDRIQYLRLSRRTFALNGLQLVSCTPGSRLNDYFPYVSPFDAAKRIMDDVGDPAKELSVGAYSKDEKPGAHLPFHKDLDPYGWKEQPKGNPDPKAAAVGGPVDVPVADKREAIASQLAQLKQTKIEVNEVG